MTRRLTPAAAVCLAVLMASCTNASPEAGRPDTSPSTSSTPSPSHPSTPAWTAEEQQAISAAQARYLSARTAINQAFQDPRAATRDKLLKAGNGDPWLISVIGDLKFFEDQGWYQKGDVVVSSVVVQSVKLGGERPEVRLTSCIDSSKTTTIIRKTGKPVTSAGDDGKRKKAQAKLVFAPTSASQSKAWYLVEEEGATNC
ncbi:hypothetical protein GCM10009741_02870 [Kribbella lupini]|uniref:Lipoprotein n=2 Tax=Kribbella lupini TaxID=291602 RepID=A0ABP4KX19_9ACTN